MNFTTTEAVVRDLMENIEAVHQLIFDFKRVLTINESACRLFHEVVLKLSMQEKAVLFTHTGHAPLLRRYLKATLGRRFENLFHAFDDNDLALESCENRVLKKYLPAGKSSRPVKAGQYELCRGFTPDELKVFASLLKHRAFKAGEIIIEFGDQAREMFFLARGSVTVFAPQANKARGRLATFSTGMIFGEMALIDGAPRSAMIMADSVVECDVLSVEDFNGLASSHPVIKIKLLKNLNLSLCRRLRKANGELSLFD